MVRIFRSDALVVQPGFCILFALMLLLIPVRWVIGWFGAVFIHEACHFIVLRLCKVPVYRITVGLFGAEMHTGQMETWQEILCALAGPVGSLLLLLLLRIYPYISLCALGQSVFNLLPIYPLDGGRALQGICVVLLGENMGTVLGKYISIGLSAIIVCLCFWLGIYCSLGVMPIIMAILIILRLLKFPCKDGKLIVQ